MPEYALTCPPRRAGASIPVQHDSDSDAAFLLGDSVWELELELVQTQLEKKIRTVTAAALANLNSEIDQL